MTKIKLKTTFFPPAISGSHLWKLLKNRIRFFNSLVVKTMERTKRAHAVYIEALKNLGPEKRLLKAFALTELTKSLFLTGLKRRYPDLSDDQLRQLLFETIDRCRNQNY